MRVYTSKASYISCLSKIIVQTQNAFFFCKWCRLPSHLSKNRWFKLKLYWALSGVSNYLFCVRNRIFCQCRKSLLIQVHVCSCAVITTDGKSELIWLCAEPRRYIWVWICSFCIIFEVCLCVFAAFFFHKITWLKIKLM